MSKAQRQRTGSRPTATNGRPRETPSKPRVERPATHGTAGPSRRSGWSEWAIVVAVGVLVGGLVAWWIWGSGTGTNEVETAEPIANVQAPDYHSLLLDPQDAERVLFGSHDGIQESHDGGFTWQAGTLHGVDAMIMATSPRAPETIYVAGHDVFEVSRDGGASWQPVSHDLPGTDIHGFAQNPADPKRLYAFVVGAGGFTSADGGSSWNQFASYPPGGSYLVLASNGEYLFAATDAGIAQSRDHGASWEPLAAQPGRVTVLSLAVSQDDPKTVYVGTPGGAFRSTDGGESWTTFGPAGVPVLAIAVTPGDPDRVLILGDQGAVYRTDDSGARWLSPG